VSEWTPTTCMRCAVGCGHLQRGADVGYGLEEVRGDANHPTNRGLACQRGIRETVDPDGEWLTEPLVRHGDTLKPVSWDTALGVVATQFIDTLANEGEEVAVLGSGQQTNEAAYALGKVARGAFGTPHYDANTTLCMASAVTAYYQAFGSDAPPPTYEDIPEAETHLVWGANPAAAHPVMYRWIVDSAGDPDSELVVVDPVASETVDDADRHVQPEPGTDLALARAVLARLVEASGVDRDFVDRWTEGLEGAVDALPSVEAAAATAGVHTEDVDRLAAALGDPTLLYWGMGVNQSTQGTDTARALIDLCLATGNMGPGSGPFSLTGQANSMGTRVCSSKGTWPGHRDFEDPDHRKAVAEAWDLPVGRLPDTAGPGPVGIVDEAARGAVEACWCVATNPVAGMPDGSTVRDALEETFLVVQDAFRSETVEYADVVLPAATWGESEGTVMNMERTVSRVTAATDVMDTVRQDIDIIAAVGNRVEPGLFAEPPLDPEVVFNELRALTAGTPADMSGISYERLEAELAVRWPTADTTSQGGYRYLDREDVEESGNQDPDAADTWSFHTESGLAQFSEAAHSPVPEPTDASYPLVLTTGRQADAYNTGVRTRGATDDDLPVLRAHPETVGEYIEQLDRGRTVVESRRGRVTVEVQPDDGVPPAVLWVDIHNPAANELTIPTVDPQSREPNFKQCAVRLTAPERSSPVTHDGVTQPGAVDIDAADW
jgi:assimilatory nitrate reductase catalytic subunit